MTPKLIYQLASVLFFVAAIVYFVIDNILLGAAFLALEMVFLAISNRKPGSGPRDGAKWK